jgi:hypothetical protein
MNPIEFCHAVSTDSPSMDLFIEYTTLETCKNKMLNHTIHDAESEANFPEKV